MFDNIVIGIVIHKPLTGYDIKKEVQAGIGNFYKASYGSLYPALKRLTTSGHLSMTEDNSSGRVKKYYVATDIGRGEFMAWLEAPMDMSSGLNAMVIKIYFADELLDDKRNRLFSECEMCCNQVLAGLYELEKSLENMPDIDDCYRQLSTLYLGINNLQDTVRWLSHIRERRPLSEFISNLK